MTNKDTLKGLGDQDKVQRRIYRNAELIAKYYKYVGLLPTEDGKSSKNSSSLNLGDAQNQ